MGNNKNTPASAGVTSKEVETKKVAKAEELVETATEETATEEVVETATEETATEETATDETATDETATDEAEVIPSDIFVAVDGTEVEFAVKHFIHSKRKYTVEEAVAEIPEVLQELYDRKSFIFKKV